MSNDVTMTGHILLGALITGLWVLTRRHLTRIVIEFRNAKEETKSEGREDSGSAS